MKNWIKHYQEFNLASKEDAPKEVLKSLSEIVRKDLNPSFLGVFLKLSLIHSLSGVMTLFVCPQFGFSLTDSPGLMRVFMSHGMGVCMLACGIFFLGTSMLVASFLMKPEEIRTLRKNRWTQISTLSTASFALMICLGAETILSLSLFWLSGALLGGLITLEVGWQLRRFAR